MNKDIRSKNWETRFNDRFVNHGEFVYNKGGYPATCGELKKFISQELQSTLKDSLERVRSKWLQKVKDRPGASDKDMVVTKLQNRMISGWNQAITDRNKKIDAELDGGKQ